jgi:hypothetical protein
MRPQQAEITPTALPPAIEVDPDLVTRLEQARADLEAAEAKIDRAHSSYRNLAAGMVPLAGRSRAADEKHWKDIIGAFADTQDSKLPPDSAAADRERLAHLDAAFRFLADWELPRLCRHGVDCQVKLLRAQADICADVGRNRMARLAGLLSGAAQFEGGLSLDSASLKSRQIEVLAEQLRAAAHEISAHNSALTEAANRGVPRSGTFDPTALPLQIEFRQIIFSEVKD